MKIKLLLCIFIFLAGCTNSYVIKSDIDATIKSAKENGITVIINNDEKRIFLTISYISNKHNEGMENNREKAFFISRPNDPINLEKDKLRLLRADPNKCINIYNTNK